MSTDGKRSSVWILGDQLLMHHPALTAALRNHAQDNLRVVLVESAARSRRRRYQRKKLVFLISAMRHYAAGLRQRGYIVDYVRAPTFVAGLRQHVTGHRTDHLYAMETSAWRGRAFQNTLSDVLGLAVTLVPNTQFLVGQYDPYPNAAAGKRIVMEHFYRRMRKHFDILMTCEGRPVGGRWNYDAENRKALPHGVRPPAVRAFEPDAITQEVIKLVQGSGNGVGSVEGFSLAVTREQALVALDDFVAKRLADFGPFEDAMSSQYGTLFHSALSPYLNVGLLEPEELLARIVLAFQQNGVPVNSAEGFVRQVLGWREYVYWQYWRLMPGLMDANAWDAQRPLPGFFWTGDSPMNCLRHAITRAIETGYNHHIERLMLLCNFCLLAGIRPREVNDWFLTLYVDAYDWVMAPNVLGMGLNADGGRIATKPYIASANYINKMSDFCGSCTYNHKIRTGQHACPFNFLYWSFLVEHEAALRANPRLGRNVLGLRHLADDERTAVRRQASAFVRDLASP